MDKNTKIIQINTLGDALDIVNKALRERSTDSLRDLTDATSHIMNKGTDNSMEYDRHAAELIINTYFIVHEHIGMQRTENSIDN